MVAALSSQQASNDPAQTNAVPTADATSKAQETANAFETKLAKSVGGKGVAHAPLLEDAPVPATPSGTAKPQVVTPAPASPADDSANVASSLLPAPVVTSDKPLEASASDAVQAQGLASGAVQGQPHGKSAAATPAPIPQPAPEVRFAETNHANIVTGVQTNLLPHGGTMQIRLDPPELGALQITVEMRNGSMSATFQTSNDDATRLLSHSLGQLKTALESQGVNVEKIQVQQAPKDQASQNHDGSSQQQLRDEANARQEQQRREILQKMWRRVSGGEPMDLVA